MRNETQHLSAFVGFHTRVYPTYNFRDPLQYCQGTSQGTFELALYNVGWRSRR
ncbi:hypothetical protein F7734_16270 [Scytonema sp. UIC 10036]|uniref:hypothetical protein n=1 Tax=Scytonema sp. UIC 10036 TaxID=2304196 RepID=UPI0012DAB124|nr:hypothetical protein [Scytonema sp. UIC 10036]MUG93878.1 hypothetical protein [Scytonema sp. UIC 10036]